ncbi:hypothetical protein ACET3Z_000944 [Daucus carota]
MFDQLSSLNTSRTNWRVKVRVTRMWPSGSNASNGKDGIVKGYNLILLDDDNCHVHAYVYGDNGKKLSEPIVEGGLYILSNFFTREALGSLKPVSSKIIINFSPATSVELVPEDDFMIPFHKFEFVDLSELFSLASSYANPKTPDYSTDVIGAVEDFEKLSIIGTMFGDREIVKFRLTDGRHSHQVTVWGKLAVSTNLAFTEATEKPVIAILSSTKLKIFNNAVQISTLPSSRVYMNLDTDIVDAMRQRLYSDGYVAPERSLSTHTDSSTVSVTPIETLSLKELSEKTSTEMLDAFFLCKVKVKAVEETSAWWFFSCIGCGEEAYTVERKFKCTAKCQGGYPVSEKRYRIVILAEDPTEGYNFVLLDRAAKRLLGKTATKLIAENSKLTSTEFPKNIRDIAGKDITLKIQLRSDNILMNSRLYYASDAFEAGQTSFSVGDATTSTASAMGDNNVVDLEENNNTPGNTPSSSRSTNKKIKRVR